MEEPVSDIRIVVVGDSGTGKTSLIHLLCHGEPLRHASKTVGFHTDVRIHEEVDGRAYFVEFLEVSGSKAFEKTRHLFFHSVDGVIFTHDLSNRNSYSNLSKWISEINASEAFREAGLTVADSRSSLPRWTGEASVLHIGDFGSGSSPSGEVPSLTVGLKEDLGVQNPQSQQRRLHSGSSDESLFRQSFPVAGDIGDKSVSLSNLSVNSLRGVEEPFRQFISRIIDRKYGSGSMGRRRWVVGSAGSKRRGYGF